MFNKKKNAVSILIKIAATILAAGLSVLMFALPVNAEDDYWELDSDTGILTIKRDAPERFDDITDRPWHADKNRIKKVVINDGVEHIEAYAFKDCQILEEVYISKTVNDIRGEGNNNSGVLPFSGCNDLTSIFVDDENEEYSSEDGVLFDKEKATVLFCPRGKKGTLTLPETVIEFAPYSFSDSYIATDTQIPSWTQLSFITFECVEAKKVNVPSTAFFQYKATDNYACSYALPDGWTFESGSSSPIDVTGDTSVELSIREATVWDGLQDLISAGGTITLTQDYDYTKDSYSFTEGVGEDAEEFYYGKLHVPNGAVIDLNDHTLTADCLIAGGDLTVKNGTLNASFTSKGSSALTLENVTNTIGASYELDGFNMFWHGTIDLTNSSMSLTDNVGLWLPSRGENPAMLYIDEESEITIKQFNLSPFASELNGKSAAFMYMGKANDDEVLEIYKRGLGSYLEPGYSFELIRYQRDPKYSPEIYVGVVDKDGVFPEVFVLKIPVFTLAVEYGSGGGNYSDSSLVQIKADEPEPGKVFDKWVCNDKSYKMDEPNSPSTTILMPDKNITLTATYKDAPKYALTVENGTGSGNYFEKKVVNITANAPAKGMEFDKWTCDDKDVSFGDASLASTTVTMPAKPVTIKATYKETTNTESLNGLIQGSDGSWYLYHDGEVDTSYNGLYEDAALGWWLVLEGRVALEYNDLYNDGTYGWWLVSGGRVDFEHTELYYSDTYGWWLVLGGKVAFGYNDLFGSNSFGWWKINNGQVDFGYSGLYRSTIYGMWVIKDGAVDFSANGEYSSTVYGTWKVENGQGIEEVVDPDKPQIPDGLGLGDDGAWYLFKNGSVMTDYNDLYHDPNLGWWLVTNGQVNFGYNDLFYSQTYGWWKISAGAVDFGFTGLYNSPGSGWQLIDQGNLASEFSGLYYDDNYGWWLINKGKLASEFSGLYYDTNYGWWLIDQGQLMSDYTGLYNDDTLGCWKINAGAVDFGYSGLYNDKNYGWCLIDQGQLMSDYTGLYNDVNYGWWKINAGAVDFGYSGLYYDEYYGWWLIDLGSLASYYTGLYNDVNYGWWKINAGAVDFGYSDLYYDDTYGWWLVLGGKVAFGYNDLYGSSQYGWWKITDGAVDFNHTGIFSSDIYGVWLINNGAVDFGYSGQYVSDQQKMQIDNGYVVERYDVINNGDAAAVDKAK